MKQTLKQIALPFARSKSGGRMVWFVLRYLPFLIPFRKLFQDQFIISIFHPVPSYKNHILLLNRIYLSNFLALDPQSETGKKFIQSVYEAMQAIMAGVELSNIQLLINGGDYQDVRLLHMHLIKDGLDFSKSEMFHTDNNDTDLSELFLKAKIRIQNTNHSAYRLIYSFQENQIKLYLQIK